MLPRDAQATALAGSLARRPAAIVASAVCRCSYPSIRLIVQPHSSSHLCPAEINRKSKPVAGLVDLCLLVAIIRGMDGCA